MPTPPLVGKGALLLRMPACGNVRVRLATLSNTKLVMRFGRGTSILAPANLHVVDLITSLGSAILNSSFMEEYTSRGGVPGAHPSTEYHAQSCFFAGERPPFPDSGGSLFVEEPQDSCKGRQMTEMKRNVGLCDFNIDNRSWCHAG